MTHDGNSLYLSTEEYLTADHAIQLVEALKQEFGEKLIVLLDQASYFYARDLWEHVSGTQSIDTVDDTSIKCAEGDKLKVWYFPSHLPELNPVESCWNQFKDWYKYRFIETLAEVKATLPEAFTSISEPDLFDHICSY